MHSDLSNNAQHTSETEDAWTPGTPAVVQNDKNTALSFYLQQPPAVSTGILYQQATHTISSGYWTAPGTANTHKARYNQFIMTLIMLMQNNNQYK